MGGCSIKDDLLTLSRDTLTFLKEEKPPVFAMAEDADYFRIGNRKALPPKPEPLFSPPKIESSVPKITAEPKKEPPLPPKEPMVQSTNLKKEAIPIPETVLLDFTTLRKLFAKIAPEVALFDEIPSDEIAKKISSRWKTKNQCAPVSILSFQEPPPQKELLEKVATALDVYFGPARIVNAETIEKEKQWEAFLSSPDLKLVIVCDYSLWQLSGLMQFYKENPAQGSRSLGSVSLFLLPDLSLYLKDPLLKRSLWKVLCQKLSS